MSQHFCSHRSTVQSVLSAAPNRLMNLCTVFAFASTVFCVPAVRLLAQTAVAVPTWRYDLTHAGQNTHETELTPANVNVNSFGKLFTHTTDGATYAQPL